MNVRMLSYNKNQPLKGQTILRIPKPTEAELFILNVLWSNGPSTVREVHDSLKERNTVYTTVLKLLQIMHEKGLVNREDSCRAHVYSAVFSRQQLQRNLVTDLVERVFQGSSTLLIQQALAANPSTPEELSEIRMMIDAMEKEYEPRD